jgi:hypothetical protein
VKITLGKARRRELGKFILDVGKLIFGGTVVTQLFSEKAASPVILLLGFAPTVAALMLGLAITPEE